MKKILIAAAIFTTLHIQAGVTDTLQVYMDGADLRVEVSDLEELEEISEHDLNLIIDEVLQTSGNMQDSLGTESEMEYEINVDGKEETPEEFLAKNRSGIYMNKFKEPEELKGPDSLSFIYLSTATPWPKENQRSVSYMEVRFGFNNYLENGSFPASGSNHSLGTLSSRSFSVAFNSQTRIFKENSPLFVKYGIDFNFNNYRLENNVRIVEGVENIEFIKDEVNDYSKSKLATIYLDVPVMFLLDFKNNETKKRDFLIGIGAYAGYRLRSITKHKYEDINGDDQKDKDKGSFYLNNFRYGLHAMIGFRGVNFFARYQVNELFEKQEKTPELNVIDFGIILAIF